MAKRQKQSYVVGDAVQLQSIVSPMRHQILRTMTSLGAASVKEVALQLERSPESLYYHFRALVKVGLLIDAGVRERSGRPEALFVSAGKCMITDPKSSDPEYLDAFKRSAGALLRLCHRQLSAELDRQALEQRPRSIAFRIQQLNARLSPKASAELARKLDGIMEFLEENNRDEGEMISVTLTSTPLGPRRE